MPGHAHRSSRSSDLSSRSTVEPAPPDVASDADFGGEWAGGMQDLMGNQALVEQVMRSSVSGGSSGAGAGDGDAGADPAEPFRAATSGPSQTIPFQAEMEGAFGQDFSDVQAHTGQQGAMHALGARAAAQGEQVAFASPSPDRAVVAHELTHVVQQRKAGGGLAMLSTVSSPGDASEREAERVAEAVRQDGEVPEIVEHPTGQLAGGWGDDALNAVGDALDVRTDEARLDAEEDLEEFRNQTFADIDRFNSPAGIGQFQVGFNARTGALAITVRVFFEFTAGEAAATSPGFRPEEFQWHGEEAAWKAQYMSTFSSAWSSPATGLSIHSTKPHWDRMLVSTNVSVVEAASAGEAHFVVRVAKYPPDARMVTSSVAPPGTHHTGGTNCDPNTAASTPANMVNSPGSTVALDSNDLRPEQKLDWGNAVVAVPFRRGHSDLSPQGTAALAPVITQMNGDATTHAELTGHASSDTASGRTADQGAIENMDMARARTDAVRAALTGAGIAADRLQSRNVGQENADATAASCRVDVQVGSNPTQTPALHEGGHMVGNGDEYATSTDPTGSPVEADYQATVTAATGDVLSRQQNANVMSLGGTIQRWNYAPFLAALKQITNMQEWGI
jgi:outer membrane protein OmpA-like peptidoglycan-associated protein